MEVKALSFEDMRALSYEIGTPVYADLYHRYNIGELTKERFSRLHHATSMIDGGPMAFEFSDTKRIEFAKEIEWLLTEYPTLQQTLPYCKDELILYPTEAEYE